MMVTSRRRTTASYHHLSGRPLDDPAGPAAADLSTLRDLQLAHLRIDEDDVFSDGSPACRGELDRVPTV